MAHHCTGYAIMPHVNGCNCLLFMIMLKLICGAGVVKRQDHLPARKLGRTGRSSRVCQKQLQSYSSLCCIEAHKILSPRLHRLGRPPPAVIQQRTAENELADMPESESSCEEVHIGWQAPVPPARSLQQHACAGRHKHERLGDGRAGEATGAGLHCPLRARHARQARQRVAKQS